MPVLQRTLVTSTEELTSSLTQLDDADVVGVDVERADSEKYWRRPALIQLGAEGTVVLADPLAALDLAPLHGFLRDRTVVLHAMDNDIAPLASVGIRPDHIEDTAVAATILGLPTGLGPLLDQLLDVRFDGNKARMQRADWSLRPMTEKMLEYAAADVADLPQLWRTMHADLVETERLTWYEQERDAIRSQPPLEERRAWTRLRGLGRLDRSAQTRAHALWHERETLARDTDTAPNRIVKDQVLLDLAVTPVDDVGGLRRAGMRRQSARAFGPQLLRTLRDSDDATPVRSRGRRFDEHERALIDDLRALRSQVADAFGLDPGVLCPNRALERAVATRPATPDELRDTLDLRPWQWELLADAFTEALETADSRPADIDTGTDDAPNRP